MAAYPLVSVRPVRVPNLHRSDTVLFVENSPSGAKRTRTVWCPVSQTGLGENLGTYGAAQKTGENGTAATLLCSPKHF